MKPLSLVNRKFSALAGCALHLGLVSPRVVHAHHDLGDSLFFYNDLLAQYGQYVLKAYYFDPSSAFLTQPQMEIAEFKKELREGYDVPYDPTFHSLLSVVKLEKTLDAIEPARLCKGRPDHTAVG
ncbi:BQ5605_C019g08870 [Microbotryum silenes-dioicae]|uniref:BQ5605_C019g08870 protein n=1 Tax=Microbotryum silenes-dioicae TaxID=796604 RepID=A0A2X0LW28_9BASI|nr:BQ5605_C019g08870 [Microbotryum silenes-dioicae]